MDLAKLSNDKKLELCKWYYTDVILSSVGTLIFAVAFISWMVTFQLQREAWGPTGDAISFIVPRGRA